MKKLGVILIAATMIAAIGTTWGGYAKTLQGEVYNVVQGKLYDADGEVVGHIQASWNKSSPIYGDDYPCSIGVKVTLQSVDPLTKYDGMVYLCGNRFTFTIETNAGGAGNYEGVWCFRCVHEEEPDCLRVFIICTPTPTESRIVSEEIALCR